MKQILIVDDDIQIRELLIEYLKNKGYTVSEADSGNSAVTLCKSSQFDVVVTDISMPGISGVELIKELITLVPKAGFIIVSGTDHSYSLASITAAGGRACFMKKPFKLTELLAAIEQMCFL